MKLDAKAMRYLAAEDFRVLTGVRTSPPPRQPRGARRGVLSSFPFARAKSKPT